MKEALNRSRKKSNSREVGGKMKRVALGSANHLTAMIAIVNHCPPPGKEKKIYTHCSSFLSYFPLYLGHLWIDYFRYTVNIVPCRFQRSMAHSKFQLSRSKTKFISLTLPSVLICFALRQFKRYLCGQR